MVGYPIRVRGTALVCLYGSDMELCRNTSGGGGCIQVVYVVALYYILSYSIIIIISSIYDIYYTKDNLVI